MNAAIKYLLLLLCMSGVFAIAENPYYGFYHSEKGSTYKKLRHNIFNFEIDLPNSWVFGTAGKPPNQVVVLHPQGLNTAIFSPGYGTVSVGILPFSDVTLDMAYEYTRLGMQQSHSDLKVVQQKLETSLSGHKAAHFIFLWPSTSGYYIRESVYLVEAYSKIYAITIRAVDPAGQENGSILQGIVSTFSPIAAVKFN